MDTDSVIKDIKEKTGMDDSRRSDKDELAARKAALLRQGEFYRVGIVHAKANVKQGARPDAIFHRAIDHATFALRSRVDGLLRPGGASVSSLMPYALSIVGFLSRRRLVRPALGVVAVAVALGWYLQRRSQRQVGVH
jgi:hypothetical protein